MQLDKKQTALLTITLLALGFLGYQIYTLVKTDLAEAQSSKSIHVMNTNPRLPAVQNTKILAQNEVSAPTETVPSDNSQNLNNSTQSSSDQKTQQEYLELLNQYELAKMKRQLLQEQATIAETQHHISQLNQNGSNNISELIPSNDSSDTEHNYQLSYVDRQNGVWSAALKIDNQYQEVAVGTLLPDNSQIINIDHEGVTVQKDSQRFLVTFNGLMNVKMPVPSSTSQFVKQEIPETINPKNNFNPKSLPEIREVKNLKATTSAILAMNSRAALKGHPIPLHPTKQNEQQTVLATAKNISNKLGIEIKSQQQTQKPVVIAEALPSNSADFDPEILTRHHRDDTETCLVPDTLLRAADAPSTSSPHITNLKLAPKKIVKKLMPVDPYLAVDQKVLKTPSDHFTIELIGSDQLTSIKQFTKQAQIDNDQDANLLGMLNNQNHRSFALIYGDYKSFSEAQLVLHYLPQSLKTHNPWIRSFADLQYLLQNKNQG